MDSERLKQYIDLGFSLSQISQKMGCSKSNTKYWLLKFGFKLKRGARGKKPKDFTFLRKCKCGEENPSEFYGNKTQVCKKCHNDDNLKRGKETRIYILEKLGNKCKNCSFDKWKASLDVHHLDPNKKDASFATIRYWSKERIEAEISQCILLCKNCHSALHNGELINENLFLVL